MRSNSGRGKASNNNLDPTLKEREASRGRSGRAAATAKAHKAKNAASTGAKRKGTA
ncbi:MAG: hypothetical protein ACT4OE_06055 [Sphingosinicella sp.]